VLGPRLIHTHVIRKKVYRHTKTSVIVKNILYFFVYDAQTFLNVLFVQANKEISVHLVQLVHLEIQVQSDP
jgi:hypothetical protein